MGNTSRRTPITAFIFGRGKKHVVVLGGVHGDEPSSAWVAGAFAASLVRHPAPANLTVIVIPRVNADGLCVGTRSNGADVDINRNFPSRTWRAQSKGGRNYPGEKPASEPETRSLIELIKQWRPVLLISIHAPLNCINWDGPAEKVSRGWRKQATTLSVRTLVTRLQDRLALIQEKISTFRP